MKLYKSEEAKEKVENSKAFSGTSPKEASLEHGAPNVSLQEIAESLLAEYQSEEVAGVELLSINFKIILKPKY